MKKFIRIISVTALSTVAAFAQAQVYVEGSVAGLTAKESIAGDSYKAKPSTFSGLVGYHLNPNLDVEGYLAVGAGPSNVTENGRNNGEQFKLLSSFGIFVKPKVMVNKEIELFGRLGYLENKYDFSKTSRNTNTNTQGSLAFGVGANYYFDKRTYVTSSYMSYHNKEGLKVNGLSIGLGYNF